MARMQKKKSLTGANEKKKITDGMGDGDGGHAQQSQWPGSMAERRSRIARAGEQCGLACEVRRKGEHGVEKTREKTRACGLDQ